MKTEEIEIVARAVKEALWESADTNFQGGTKEHSIWLDEGNDERVATRIAHVAIAAIERHRGQELGKTGFGRAPDLKGK
ncbi:hypothetical protein AA309_31175 [Microvirga vignae]|uniref:Uncharacterized protein n=1 Tax=Microvirga vignae TaxID=1225564 RepID=A0A0H1R2Y1_9HYPH|nr:hypothetical protein [Microvirga vignae]KLK89473.1 hypothetical protein AA309_31175 [Microvirga vignae]